VRLGKAVPFLGACLGIRARHEEHVHQSHVPALGSEVERAEPAAWHGIRVAAPLELLVSAPSGESPLRSHSFCHFRDHSRAFPKGSRERGWPDSSRIGRPATGERAMRY